MLVLATGTVAPAMVWALIRAGAGDVIDARGCAATDVAHRAAQRLARWAAVDELVRSSLVRDNLVGRSRAWVALLRQLVEIATFTSGAVLILGESGTGKELLARLVHTLDRRADKGELVVVDSTTIVPELAGSEFFGHERGSYTGAAGSREGAFALADKGTLFLDEVGELPLGLQAQLLRVVQEKVYKRVGGNTWHPIDFRLVCATNRDLTDGVVQGTFRRDFFHRIASRVVHVPPLRDRPEDIVPLAEHFLGQLCPGRRPPGIDAPVAELLVRRSYAGNVRELRQLVARMYDRYVGPGPLGVGDVPLDELACAPEAEESPDLLFERAVERALVLGVGLKDIGRIASNTAIRLALASEDGNLQRAARRLGVTDRALQMRRAQQA